MKKLSLYGLLIVFSLGCTKDDSSFSAGEVYNSGKGGSTAKFTISQDVLYVVNPRTLKAFDISTPSAPRQVSETLLGTDIETIFPKGNHLFIGAQSGMHIYDISNKYNPQFVSTYTHVVSCDPVVAHEDYAFVTLRNGTSGPCRRGINSLDVLDISNPAQPKVVARYPMTQPRGLGIDANWNLFVCDGKLKHLDATNPRSVIAKNVYDAEEPLDVIPVGDRLLLIAKDGLYQYKIENNQLVLLSKISVG